MINSFLDRSIIKKKKRKEKEKIKRNCVRRCFIQSRLPNRDDLKIPKLIL